MSTYTEVPDNFQQKCLCVLLLDVSGTMVKNYKNEDRLNKLNEAIVQFYDDIANGKNGVAKATVGQLEVAIVSFDQEPKLVRGPKLLSKYEIVPQLESRGSTTETVKAIRYALDLIEKRKHFYAQTGQTYYRPWIVLMTDGGTSSHPVIVDELAEELKEKIDKKRLSMIGVAIGDDVPLKFLSKLSGGHPVALEGLRFAEFFRWLSRSMSTITKSNDDDSIDISVDADSWMKNYNP